MFMGSWIMQEYWDSDIFWLGDESVRVFRHFAFWRHGFKLATILHMYCIFVAHLLS